MTNGAPRWLAFAVVGAIVIGIAVAVWLANLVAGPATPG